MINRKRYIKPELTKISLDNTISLQMASGPPSDPGDRIGSSKKGNSEPFASPFGDKPFK